jgi:hypothetical protein
MGQNMWPAWKDLETNRHLAKTPFELKEKVREVEAEVDPETGIGDISALIERWKSSRMDLLEVWKRVEVKKEQIEELSQTPEYRNPGFDSPEEQFWGLEVWFMELRQNKPGAQEK